MTKSTILVGLDGSEAGERALAFAKKQAELIGDCTIAICYVIEWSPFSFQTPEENEQRHGRRKEELKLANERVIDPALALVKKAGFDAIGIVRHGDVADTLEELAKKHDVDQIVVGRVGARGLKERLFGGVSGRLVATASVPVTIIP